MRVKGGVFERIATRMWEIEGDIYGSQQGDNKYGQQTTEAMKQQRRARTEFIQSVDVLRLRESDLRGIFEVWGRWNTMQRAERDLLKVHRLERRQWQDRIQDELWEACRLNHSAENGGSIGYWQARKWAPNDDDSMCLPPKIPTVRDWAQQMRKQRT